MRFAYTYRSPDKELYLFRFDVAENVVTEFPRTSKELLFRSGERNVRVKFQFQEVEGTNEVGKLEKPISTRLHVVGEFNLAVQASLEHLMKKPRDGGLPAVVVYLDAADGQKCIMACSNKLGERYLELFNDLVCGIDISLVDREAMVSVIDPAGESHHAGEYSSPQLTAQHGVVFFAANERAGMKAMPFQSDFGIRAFKVGNVGGYVNGLVVEDHAENVESTFGIWETEIPRLVDKDTKYFCLHANPAKKREWRDTSPATHAESFPRIPVTPAHGRRSIIIVSNRRVRCKGASA